ncbi:hypothetical protein D1AOALGA4SA_8331 [Olavius algarvensis Delta 1 endosymbiont]|nr:hypothetical protein D1AOALGA4SA_8331 [Olavius algarvensis Delta 1 endosymbiont]
MFGRQIDHHESENLLPGESKNDILLLLQRGIVVKMKRMAKKATPAWQ